jgi:hypothetical protein
MLGYEDGPIHCHGCGELIGFGNQRRQRVAEDPFCMWLKRPSVDEFRDQILDHLRWLPPESRPKLDELAAAYNISRTSVIKATGYV